MSQTSDITCELCSAGSVDGSTATGKKVFHLIGLLVCATILIAAFVLWPQEEGLSLFGYRWPFYCWLHETLGVNCALCGMSRSFCSLAHGDLEASFGFHSLGPFLFAILCLEVAYRLYAVAILPRGIDRRLSKAHVSLVVLVCAAILFNWFVYLERLIV